jgi:hypothetical protein
MAASLDKPSPQEEAARKRAGLAMDALWRNFVAPESLGPEARPHLLQAQSALDTLSRTGAFPRGLAAPAFRGDPAAMRVKVYAASQGTAYNLEQRDALVRCLRACGAAAEAGDEAGFGPDEGAPAILLGPHEFLRVSQGLRKLARDKGGHGRRLLMVNTTPVASEGFQALLAVGGGAAFVQGDLPSAVMLRAMGAPAYFLPPVWAADTEGPLPRFARGGVHVERRVREFVPGARDAWAERPLDLASFNIYTPWIKASLARLAPALSLRSCMLLRIQGNGEVVHPEGAYISAALARRAKIILRLGASPLGMDSGPASLWSGWLAGALLLSEPGFKHPGFVAGEHYVECPLERMPQALAFYLDTEEGRAEAGRIRDRAREALARHYPAGRLALGLLGLLAGEA